MPSPTWTTDLPPAEWLTGFADQLDDAPRIGAATDEREGERYIQMSDTLARLIAGQLRKIARGMKT